MDGVVLVPFGLWGTEGIYSLEDDRLRPTVVHGRFGPALEPSRVLGAGARDDVVAAARVAVAALLPPARRGADDEEPV
jgi:hypothetical protein